MYKNAIIAGDKTKCLKIAVNWSFVLYCHRWSVLFFQNQFSEICLAVKSRIRKQKDKQPVLSENMGGEIEGKLNIQDLVGKIIKVKNQPRTMNILKVKEVSLWRLR